MSRLDRLDELVRGLDRRFLPGLAARLRRAGSAVVEDRRLRRLDARYARGPLALVRELPQVGLLVVAAVFLAGTTAVVVDRGGPSTVAQAADPGVAAPGPDAAPVDRDLVDLGPTAGQDAADYLSGARARLDGATAGEGPFLALVSLAAPLPAEGVAGVLGPATLVGVLLQVPSPDGSLPVSLLDATDPAAVPAAFAARAATRGTDAAELTEVAATIEATTPEEVEAKALFEREAASAVAESQQLAAGCPCVVALVVRGSGPALAAVMALPGVRAVDPGRAGASTLADVRLLPPGVEGAVPAGSVQRG